jgi:formylmethanofuran dehydrogenase subunit B
MSKIKLKVSDLRRLIKEETENLHAEIRNNKEALLESLGEFEQIETQELLSEAIKIMSNEQVAILLGMSDE